MSLDGRHILFGTSAPTARTLAAIMKDAGTIVWNGPVGVFELMPLPMAKVLALIADSDASIAGGGDTLAAISKFGITDKVFHFHRWRRIPEILEGKTLPAVEILEQRQRPIHDKDHAPCGRYEDFATPALPHRRRGAGSPHCGWRQRGAHEFLHGTAEDRFERAALHPRTGGRHKRPVGILADLRPKIRVNQF